MDQSWPFGEHPEKHCLLWPDLLNMTGCSGIHWGWHGDVLMWMLTLIVRQIMPKMVHFVISATFGKNALSDLLCKNCIFSLFYYVRKYYVKKFFLKMSFKAALPESDY